MEYTMQVVHRVTTEDGDGGGIKGGDATGERNGLLIKVLV